MTRYGTQEKHRTKLENINKRKQDQVPVLSENLSSTGEKISGTNNIIDKKHKSSTGFIRYWVGKWISSTGCHNQVQEKPGSASVVFFSLVLVSVRVLLRTCTHMGLQVLIGATPSTRKAQSAQWCALVRATFLGRLASAGAGTRPRQSGWRDWRSAASSKYHCCSHASRHRSGTWAGSTATRRGRYSPSSTGARGRGA